MKNGGTLNNVQTIEKPAVDEETGSVLSYVKAMADDNRFASFAFCAAKLQILISELQIGNHEKRLEDPESRMIFQLLTVLAEEKRFGKFAFCGAQALMLFARMKAKNLIPEQCRPAVDDLLEAVEKI